MPLAVVSQHIQQDQKGSSSSSDHGAALCGGNAFHVSDADTSSSLQAASSSSSESTPKFPMTLPTFQTDADGNAAKSRDGCCGGGDVDTSSGDTAPTPATGSGGSGSGSGATSPPSSVSVAAANTPPPKPQREPQGYYGEGEGGDCAPHRPPVPALLTVPPQTSPLPPPPLPGGGESEGRASLVAGLAPQAPPLPPAGGGGATTTTTTAAAAPTLQQKKIFAPYVRRTTPAPLGSLRSKLSTPSTADPTPTSSCANAATSATAVVGAAIPPAAPIFATPSLAVHVASPSVSSSQRPKATMIGTQPFTGAPIALTMGPSSTTAPPPSSLEGDGEIANKKARGASAYDEDEAAFAASCALLHTIALTEADARRAGRRRQADNILKMVALRIQSYEKSYYLHLAAEQQQRQHLRERDEEEEDGQQPRGEGDEEGGANVGKKRHTATAPSSTASPPLPSASAGVSSFEAVLTAHVERCASLLSSRYRTVAQYFYHFYLRVVCRRLPPLPTWCARWAAYGLQYVLPYAGSMLLGAMDAGFIALTCYCTVGTLRQVGLWVISNLLFVVYGRPTSSSNGDDGGNATSPSTSFSSSDLFSLNATDASDGDGDGGVISSLSSPSLCFGADEEAMASVSWADGFMRTGLMTLNISDVIFLVGMAAYFFFGRSLPGSQKGRPSKAVAAGSG